jgi:hypothetical protein
MLNDATPVPPHEKLPVAFTFTLPSTINVVAVAFVGACLYTPVPIIYVATVLCKVASGVSGFVGVPLASLPTSLIYLAPADVILKLLGMAILV